MMTAVQIQAEARRRRRLAHRPQVGMEWRGDNERAQTITDRAWIVSGPAETGKTYAALYRLHQEAQRWPKSQWAIVRKLRSTMDGTVLNTWRRLIGSDVVPFGGNHPQWYDYPIGARVWVGGLDNPDKILSAERDGIYVNQAEELDEADWETLSTRTTGRGAITETPMLFGDCNPGPEDHWIIRRRDTGALTLLESRHEDNPTLWDGGWTEQGRRTLSALDALTGVRYQRLRLGRWVGAEGQYFTQLDEGVHLVERPLFSGWSAWGALDYGFAHPFVFLVFAQSPHGRIYVVGRHARHHWYIPQHVQAMDDLLTALALDKRTLRIVAGHDCWATGHDDPETIADKLARFGFRLDRAVLSRVIGARAVGERLGNPESGVAPSLFFAEQVRPVFTALTRMVHDPRNTEDVLKVNADAEGRGGDDDYDCLRYGVMAAAQSTTIHTPARVANRWKVS